jgi:hypothetical protein
LLLFKFPFIEMIRIVQKRKDAMLVRIHAPAFFAPPAVFNRRDGLAAIRANQFDQALNFLRHLIEAAV